MWGDNEPPVDPGSPLSGREAALFIAALVLAVILAAVLL